ncbi:MAG: AMP-binding protein [Alphaproteobacteria bacterium]|nr:AMP-binding protein [Alphaproteobacteria bacterium]
MLKRAATYREIYDAFAWRVPARYNMAVDLCDRHAAQTPGKVALIHDRDRGEPRRYRFGELAELARRAANAFAGVGLNPGDRVGLLLPQTPEALVTHLACWRSGLISLPVSIALDEETLAYRLNDVEVALLVTDRARYPRIQRLRTRLPSLRIVSLIDGADIGARDFHADLARASPYHAAADTGPDDPAFLAHTSGSTGPSKAVVHGHRMLIGHLPGFDFAYEFFGQPGDLTWSPADWAGGGALSMAVMQALWFGHPTIACHVPPPFDPERVYGVLGRHRVGNLYMMATGFKQIRAAPPPADVKLRAVISAGEPVGAEMVEWSKGALGVGINEVFGQNECNFLLAHVPKFMAARPGSLGLPPPGFVASVVDAEGRELGAGEVGELACRSPNPVLMIEYWRNPEATRAKFKNGWYLTGDLARRDDQGYFWHQGRPEDVIRRGRRLIAPVEIEDAALKHRAVANAAAIGTGDPEAHDGIKLFVTLKDGAVADTAVTAELSALLAASLATDARPSAIAIIDALPLTSTGKVMRRALREREAVPDAAPSARRPPPAARAKAGPE